MVAKHGWMLKSVPPCDVLAFYRGADKLVGKIANAQWTHIVAVLGIGLLEVPEGYRSLERDIESTEADKRFSGRLCATRGVRPFTAQDQT